MSTLPTFIVFKGSKEVKRVEGRMSVRDLLTRQYFINYYFMFGVLLLGSQTSLVEESITGDMESR